MKSKGLNNFFRSLDMFGHQIGVHYNGYPTYQTKLGAFCTLAAYAVILINTYTLVSAFNDHSKQSEKTQIKHVDSFITEPFYLADLGFEIASVIFPPMPENIGSLKLSQNDKLTKIKEIETVKCSEETMRQLDEFWIPRTGSRYTIFRDYIKCYD